MVDARLALRAALCPTSTRTSSTHGIMVLTLAADRISAITRFIDSALLPHVGLPRTLPAYPRHHPDHREPA